MTFRPTAVHVVVRIPSAGSSTKPAAIAPSRRRSCSSRTETGLEPGAAALGDRKADDERECRTHGDRRQGDDDERARETDERERPSHPSHRLRAAEHRLAECDLDRERERAHRDQILERGVHRTAARRSSAGARRPASAAPSASPPMNAARTVLAAATV